MSDGFRFKKRLPAYIGRISDIDDTLIAEDKEFDRLENLLYDFTSSFTIDSIRYVSNPDFYLTKYENDFGLSHSGTIDERIDRIKVRMLGKRTTTEKALLDLCQSFGVEGEFYPDYGFYRFLLELRTRNDFNLKNLEKMGREIIPAHLKMDTQVAVLTDAKFASAFISGEHIVISQPALDDLVSEYPLYVRTSNVGTYEHIEIKNKEYL